MLDIIYEDNHLLVVNKPAGLLTQPSGTAHDSLEAQAKEWIKLHYNKPGNVFLHAVHRLDKPVSGIVLFARTSKSLERMQAMMRNKESHKTYVAVVEGQFDFPQGTLENYLMHDEHHARVCHENEPNAKFARLHYRVRKEMDGLTEIEIDLETGRYHQIRVQLSEAGHPIIGDEKYGSRIDYIEGQIALHHIRLEIKHPTTGVLQRFEAPLPASWPRVE